MAKRIIPLVLSLACAFLIFGTSISQVNAYFFAVNSVQEAIDSNGHSVSLTFSLPSGYPISGTTYILIANPTGATNLTKFAGTGATSLTSAQLLGSYGYPSNPAFPNQADPNFPYQGGGYSMTITGGQYATAEYVFTGTSATGTIYIGLYGTAGQGCTWAKYTLSKQGCNAISIDTRKMYGQPNLAGELPANQLDPNVPMRNVNFNGWTFKGGLFVGHAPTYTNDESGTARIQAYITPLSSGTPIAACMTMFWLSNPTNYTDTYTLQAYAPDSTDPNYNFSPWTSAVWSNGWNLSLPHVAQLGSAAMNTTFLPNAYFNISILGAPKNNTTNVIPVALAMNPEPAPGSAPKSWSYFVTPAYETQVPSVTDKEPRAWLATNPANHVVSGPTTTSSSSTSTSTSSTTGGSTTIGSQGPSGPTTGE